MSILLSEDLRVVVQGMTGKEGQRATKEMLAYGTKVCCGVTPGKGGERVLDLPVFDSVAEAKQYEQGLNTSVLFVPPLMVLDAAIEAMDAGISLLVIVTENVPILDAAKLVEYARRTGARVVGPSSVGVIVPGVAKLGSIGGGRDQRMYTPGRVGVISKSGGMTAETCRLLTEAGIGQSTAIGIGGDVIIGSTFTDLMALFEQDEETDAVVLFGEVGGAYEEEAARMLKERRFTKPVVAFVSGTFAEQVQGLALGHAGAIVERGFGTAEQKRAALREAGALVARYHDDIPGLVSRALENKGRSGGSTE
ncbi:succinate--CoA ligase subunit alpha [Candidatus Woesearchaeota archaeon]|nr:MAG: succinate--CoA ligase subunit alpha [Candidatus Woesearchaeota archaeon]